MSINSSNWKERAEHSQFKAKFYDALSGEDTWIRRNAIVAYEKSRSEGLNPEYGSAEEAASVALWRYKESLKSAESALKPLVGTFIRPCELPLKAVRYIFSFVEDRYLHYTLEFPEDKEMEKQWNLFKRNLSGLSYNRDPKIKEKIKAFLDALTLNLKRCKVYPVEFEKDEHILEALKPILDNPDMDCYSLGRLAGSSKKVSLSSRFVDGNVLEFEISIFDLKDAYGLVRDRISEEVFWGLQEIKKILKPFEGTIENENFVNFLKQTLKYVDKSERRLSLNLGFLKVDDIDEILQLKEKVAEIFDFLDSRPQPILRDAHNGVRSHRRALEEMIELYGEDYVDVFEYDFSKVLGVKEPFIGKMTIAEQKRDVKLLEALQECHMIFDIHVINPVVNIRSIVDSMDLWHAPYKKFKRFKGLMADIKAIEALRKSGIVSDSSSSSSSGPVEDIDVIMRSFAKTSPTKTSPTKKRHKSKRVKGVAPGQKIASISDGGLENSSLMEIIPRSVSAPAISQQVTPVDKMHVLQSRLQSLLREAGKSHSKKWAALAQTRLSLEDLLISYNQGKKGLNSLNRSRIYSSVVLKSFYAIEQALRYKNLLQGSKTHLEHTHNIRLLAAELGQEALLDKSIIKMVSCANFWAAYPHDQMNRWRQLAHYRTINVPTVLNDLVALSERGSCQNEALHAKIQQVYQETVDLISELMTSKKKAKSCSHVSLEDLSPSESFGTTIEITRLERIAFSRRFKVELEGGRFSHSDTAVRCLKQADRSLLFFNQTMSQLELGKALKPRKLSFLVRNAIFWFNNVVESYLQARYVAMSGDDRYTHDVAGLLKKVFPSVSKEDFDFIEKAFRKINNDCRYPYEHMEARSQLHGIILQAELLRVRPELAQGFSTSSASGFSTNFIAPENARSAETIVFGLNDIIERTCAILSKIPV
jgi:HEPN domain-containing protein